jgi:uracil-DNA glycosylase
MRPSSSEKPAPAEAPKSCALCPRLAGFREANAKAEPAWFNGAVPSFGSSNATLLIVGLAPGLQGANRTGRPFTGDYAGELLYSTLLKFGFAKGTYRADPNDGLTLVDCMITNAVRCVPPENKPLPAEIAACRPFLASRLAALPRLRAMIALGRIAHDQTLATLGLQKSKYPFSHGAHHTLSPTMTLFDSFHCSRYNTNTGRLTEAMFHQVFESAQQHLRTPDIYPSTRR